jgi:hypothetical protein
MLLAFMIGYVVLLIVVSRYYLIPAMIAWRDATEVERGWLSAASALLLAVILLTLVIGLLMVFQIRRFFFPPPPRQRIQTRYTDAWAESARRVKMDQEREERE